MWATFLLFWIVHITVLSLPPPHFPVSIFFFIFFSLYAPKDTGEPLQKNFSGGDQSGPVASLSSLHTLTLLASLSVHLWLRLLARWVTLALIASNHPIFRPSTTPPGNPSRR